MPLCLQVVHSKKATNHIIVHTHEHSSDIHGKLIHQGGMPQSRPLGRETCISFRSQEVCAYTFCEHQGG